MQTAKLIILSSFGSALLVLGVLYIGREVVQDVLHLPTATPVNEVRTITSEMSQVIPDLVERVNSAVVSVVVTKDVPVYERYLDEYNPFGDWFGGFSVPKVREKGRESQEVGGGSGFIVSAEGLIVTNRHVVADEEATYSVVLTDGTTHAVTVKAKDPVLDIAILQISDDLASTTLPYLSFGDSDKMRLGDTVVVIGNALAEFSNSVSVGIISGAKRSITASDGRGQTEQLSDVFQTDAAINPGNSGGPMLNLAGEVVGMSVAASLGAENIGFAIPANAVKQVVESVKNFGEIRRPFLGVRYTMITERLAKTNNLKVDYGALIARGQTVEELAVMPGSPADKAGLRENDIILKIDGEELRDIELATLLRQKTVGATLTLTILRQGKEETVTVTLESAPNE